jgi:hypothetical protein
VSALEETDRLVIDLSSLPVIEAYKAKNNGRHANRPQGHKPTHPSCEAVHLDLQLGIPPDCKGIGNNREFQPLEHYRRQYTDFVDPAIRFCLSPTSIPAEYLVRPYILVWTHN